MEINRINDDPSDTGLLRIRDAEGNLIFHTDDEDEFLAQADQAPENASFEGKQPDDIRQQRAEVEQQHQEREALLDES